MDIWEFFTPTIDNINTIKKNYNKLLTRMNKANEFLKTVKDQEIYAIEIRIEILEPMDRYIQILTNWSIQTSNEERRDGFII